MEKTKLLELLRMKMDVEYNQFKRRMLKMRTEEIYERSYKIEVMCNIYEYLKEHILGLDTERIQCLLVMPSILSMFYRRWMKQDDSFMDELKECIINAENELFGARELEKTENSGSSVA